MIKRKMYSQLVDGPLDDEDGEPIWAMTNERRAKEGQVEEEKTRCKALGMGASSLMCPLLQQKKIGDASKGDGWEEGLSTTYIPPSCTTPKEHTYIFSYEA